jgi:hypothetical protein
MGYPCPGEEDIMKVMSKPGYTALKVKARKNRALTKAARHAVRFAGRLAALREL